ncbi:MAG: hypothetical protein JWL79_3086 [Frankiales bacterium]|nr:hypothetical protein [Frankiales bacterium]
MSDLLGLLSAALEALTHVPVLGAVDSGAVWPPGSEASGCVTVDVLEDLPTGRAQVCVLGPDEGAVLRIERDVRRLTALRADGEWLVPLAGVVLRTVDAGLCSSAEVVAVLVLGRVWEARVGWSLWGVGL